MIDSIGLGSLRNGAVGDMTAPGKPRWILAHPVFELCGIALSGSNIRGERGRERGGREPA